MTITKYVRLATSQDIPILLRFAKNFQTASPYKTMPFDSQKGKRFLEGLIKGSALEGIVLVALDKDTPIGFLVGAAHEPVFSSTKVAMELGWWVEPNFRNSRSSYLLYKAYEDWAYRIGCSYVQGAYLPGVSPDLDKFYKRLGYIQTESSYMKTLRIEI